jgi:hypothetical protein
MFRSRSSLQRKDRESGLAFNWRVPVSSTGMFFLAFVLVSGGAVALGLMVQIQFGEDREIREHRATVVLVPADAGGAWLERQAVEAGPFPSRWNPEADPGLAQLREELLVETESMIEGRRYEPRLIAMEFRPGQTAPTHGPAHMTMPPVPQAAPPTPAAGTPEMQLAVRVVSGERNGPVFELVGLPVPAEESSGLLGTRFLVGYEADGSIRDVVPLDPDDHGTVGAAWVHRGRVNQTGDKPGWTVVEYVLQP